MIALAEAGLGPLLAGDDAAIQFDGDAISFHAQLFQQTGERKRRGKIARFPVKLKFHLQRLSQAAMFADKGLGQASTFRNWNLRVAVRPE